MSAQKQFGRRVVPQAVTEPPPKQADAPLAEEVARDDTVFDRETTDHEPYDWSEPPGPNVKPPRAPWRTVVVVASVGFGATSWLLPQDVANVTDIAFGILGAASLYVGYRSWRQAAAQKIV